MKKLCGALLSLAFAIVMMTGCSFNKSNLGNQYSPNIEKFVEESETDSVEMGRISHGLRAPVFEGKNVQHPLQYDGGEMSVAYNVKASGEAKNVGFLIFVDGIPQPYKIDSRDAPNEYMHIFDFTEDDKDTPFTFIFTPVTGRIGETVKATILSVFRPSFQPDMKETVSYGGYHQILQVNTEIEFNQDAPVEKFSDTPLIISEKTFTYEAVTNALFDEISGGAFEITQEYYDSNVFSMLYYDDEIIRTHNLKVKSQGQLSLTYKLCGATGAKYRTTFYINHQPVASQDTIAHNIDVKKDKISVLKVELDLSKLGDFNTFYAISVPLNSSDYTEANIMAQKTQSVLLYK
jgi:hypothetical protein